LARTSSEIVTHVIPSRWQENGVNTITKTACIWTGMLLAVAGVVAQDAAPGAARDVDPAAVSRGAGLFRERCAECHGADAKGVAGHDLTRLWSAGATDARVLQTIRNGVPNTLMPSSTAPDEELRAMVAYLRSLNGPASAEPSRGNAENGERVFWASCGSCHAVKGRGGVMGPDFSRVAQSGEALTQAIRDPNASIATGYQAVMLVTRDGQRIRGARKSEDALSIQIMETNGRLRGFLKSNLRDVINEPASLMPAFGSDTLSDADLNDVLTFLNTLRTPGSGRGAGRGGAPGRAGGPGRF
jgi:putative heme-binding domain-containing protein